MSAEITAYSAHPEDLRLTIKWECVECGVEGGWFEDTPKANVLCQTLADRHNTEEHSA